MEGLTRPAKPSETRRDEGAVARNPETVILSGTFDEVNRIFHENNWSDAYPIVPPTVDRVKQFLKFTDRDPHEEIAVLPVSYQAATPWNIAVNGVMAGCRPEYMPILIAAAEAMGNPEYDITGCSSTGGYIPFLVINGPVAEQLDIRSDLPCISNFSNAVIGRAVGMMLRNIAGFIPGVTAMGTFGYKLPFVFAEHEDVIEEIGWEPLHVRRGFDKKANVLTVGGSGNWGHQSNPVGADVDVLLQMGIREIDRRVISERALKRKRSTTMFTLVITPPIARVLARGGYTIPDLVDHWFHNTTRTYHEQDFRYQYGTGQATSPPPTLRSLIEAGTLSREWFDKKSDEMVPVLPTPDSIHILVAGDSGRNKYTSFWAPYFRPASTEIRLPKNWEALLKEARQCAVGTCPMPAA